MGSIRKPTTPGLSLIVPGDPETRTGGYIYDRRIAGGLDELGWCVDVHALDSSFPWPTPTALRHAASVLGGMPDGRIVVIDGLALGGLSELLENESKRLCLVALVHHPLALETGLDAETAQVLRKSEKASLAFVRRVVVTSRWTSRALCKYDVAPDRIRVVEPGVDIRPRQREAGAGARSPNLLCVATLTARKGHAVLFDALARLRGRPWHLRCVGSLARDPGTADSLRQQIDRLQLGARITLVGEIDEPALEHEYGSCDVFVLASYMEGYGMVLTEAIAHGVPIVSTTAGAIPETVSADSSLLVPPGDDRALADALARIMDDAETRGPLTTSALASDKSRQTWSQASKQFAAVLENLGGNEP